MNNLWLISESEKLQQCSRLVIGYITQGNFSIHRGCGSGQGYVAVSSLMQLCEGRLRDWRQGTGKENNGQEVEPSSKRRKLEEYPHEDHAPVKYDVSMPILRNSGVFVLVRNINSCEYSYGLMTLCKEQPHP